MDRRKHCKKTLARVQAMRQSATRAEAILWRRLRDRRLDGFKFRRQHPFGGYILDFYCEEGKLAIEVDGESHAKEEREGRDHGRTMALQEHGIHVLRFWNLDVTSNLRGVLEAIRRVLHERAGGGE